jgi:hypothetical protein
VDATLQVMDPVNFQEGENLNQFIPTKKKNKKKKKKRRRRKKSYIFFKVLALNM